MLVDLFREKKKEGWLLGGGGGIVGGVYIGGAEIQTAEAARLLALLLGNPSAVFGAPR